MPTLKSVLARRRRAGWPAAIGIVVTLLVVTANGAQSVAGATFTIQARNYEFAVPGGGSHLTVPVGSVVAWVASGDPHTVTSGAPGSIDNRFADHPASAGLLTTGQSYSTTFGIVGTFPYFCEVHPEQMSGVVTVVATSTKAPTPAPTRPPTPRPSAVPKPTSPPTPTLAQPSPSSTRTASPPPAVLPSPGTASTAPSSAPSGSPEATGDAGSPVPVQAGPAEGRAVSYAAPILLALGGLVALVIGWMLTRRRRV